MLRARAVLLAHLHHVCRGLGLTVRGPRIHQLAPLLQRVTSTVCLFGLVTNDMGQRRLGNFAREVGDIPRPIAEAGAKTIRSSSFIRLSTISIKGLAASKPKHETGPYQSIGGGSLAALPAGIGGVIRQINMYLTVPSN